MYTISKEFTFSASHQLIGLPKGHKCGQLHGHNYTVIVLLSSEELDEHGFVEDYGELKDIKEFIDTTFDHQHLNDILTINPTAENIAHILFDTFCTNHKKLVGIGVKETDKTVAWYYKEQIYS